MCEIIIILFNFHLDKADSLKRADSLGQADSLKQESSSPHGEWKKKGADGISEWVTGNKGKGEREGGREREERREEGRERGTHLVVSLL